MRLWMLLARKSGRDVTRGDRHVPAHRHRGFDGVVAHAWIPLDELNAEHQAIVRSVVGRTILCQIGGPMLDPIVPATLQGAVEVASERYGITGPDWRALVVPPGPEEPAASPLELLGPEAYAAAVESGRRMTLEQAVDFLEAMLAQADLAT